MSGWGVDQMLAGLSEMGGGPAPAPAPPPAARAAAQVRRSYEAGNYLQVVPDWAGDIRGEWQSLASSANLELMVRRSRAAFKNTPEMRRFGKIYQRHVIGPDGIALQNQSRDFRRDAQGRMTSVLDRVVNKAIEAGFRQWGKRGTPTLCRRHSWRSLQHFVGLSLARDGEFLAIEHFGVKNGWGYAIQIMDPLQLNHHLNIENFTKTTRIIQGVEVDQFGAPVAYYFLKPEHFRRGVTHTGPREHARVSADRVRHVLHPEFALQTRGVPPAHAVMFNNYALGEYGKAHLIASVLGAQQVMVIETDENAEADAGFNFDEDEGPEQGSVSATTDADGAKRVTTSAGEALELAPGKRVSNYKPNAPNLSAESLVRGEQYRIAGGLDVVEWMLSGALKDVNLSTARIARQEFVDSVRILSADVIEALHDPVYENVLPNGLMRGKFTWPDGRPLVYSVEKFAKWNAATWQPRGYAYMDPAKDAAADEQNLRNGLAAPQDIAAARGLDYETLLEKQAEALDLHKTLGLPAPNWAAPKAPAGAPAEPDPAPAEPPPTE